MNFILKALCGALMDSMKSCLQFSFENSKAKLSEREKAACFGSFVKDIKALLLLLMLLQQVTRSFYFQRLEMAL